MKTGLNRNAAIELLRSRGDIRAGEFRSPIGRICVLGSDESLVCVMFVRGRSDEQIAASFKKKSTTQVAAALMFLENYFKKTAAPLPEMDLSGFTEKERAVYRALMKIPFGETISYGALASRAGITRGARFAGNAMAKNSFPILIPCHRVIQSSGAMGYYTGGVATKESLLRHEGSL